LAGGVAHDLNNLLSPILGFSELLLEDTNINDSGKEKLEQIIKAGMGARDLVRQLLAFSRKQTLEYKPLLINETLIGFEKLLQRTIRENIEIKFALSPRIRPVMADISQIEQVIMNLVVNAADAMPEGGKLTIETEPAVLDENYAAHRSGVSPGDYIMLAISDTGCGMDEETRMQIFEPFFSTKGELGTGLGLATVYGIVKQHKGNIWVYSEPGMGTTFKVFLPVSVKKPFERKIIERTTADLKGSETILLVEDNKQVSNIVREILHRQGYTVLLAKNGKEAFKTLGSHNGTVHLLLTDVIMPDINGKELFIKLVQEYPALKVLYMSGYTNNVIVHHGVLDDGVQFIQKPFTTQALSIKVREVLDK
jgi:CheY-like chemotaxis protein